MKNKLFFIGFVMMVAGFVGLALTHDGIFNIGLFGMILILLNDTGDSSEKEFGK